MYGGAHSDFNPGSYVRPDCLSGSNHRNREGSNPICPPPPEDLVGQ